jgi:hypothetical protein
LPLFCLNSPSSVVDSVVKSTYGLTHRL